MPANFSQDSETYMTGHTPSASFYSEALPPLPSSSMDVPEITKSSASNITSSESLMGRKSPLAKSFWLTDTADLFILLCSFLLTAISIVFIASVLSLEVTQGDPTSLRVLSFLQRIISSLSITITSAVIMVAGKRYVFFKLAKGGLRSTRVAVYSNPSIGALISYLVLHGAELPLLGLSAVWVLGLVTSLTVNSSWGSESIPLPFLFQVPSGPLSPTTPGSSFVDQALALLSHVQFSVCMGLEQTYGVVNITNATGLNQLVPLAIYYPPLRIPSNIGFSFPTTMNGFNISIEALHSIPLTAQNLSCYDSSQGEGWSLWSNGSNNQTLSIVVGPTYDGALQDHDFGIIQYNATAIVMGGTLSSTGNSVEFSLDGASWPNIMPNSQWAQDITSLVCNVTFQIFDNQCQGSSLIDFMNIKSSFGLLSWLYVTLNMAIGAYTSVVYTSIEHSTVIPAYGAQLKSQYGIYILTLYIVVSLVVLVVVVKLRLTSPLGADFINSTRLLLDPLKKPELFNSSLDATLDALGDPYIVIDGGELLVTEEKATKED